MYQLYQHLASFTNVLITNVNVNIYIKNLLIYYLSGFNIFKNNELGLSSLL